ncbi:MAG: adenylate/guanylate cyclase domain-containing protein [Sandaracinaceae bacterium]
MTAPAPSAVPAPRTIFPLGLKLAAMAALLSIVPLTVSGIALYGVNASAVEQLSREVQLLALGDLSQAIDQEFVEAQDALDMIGALFTNDALDDSARLTVMQAMVQGQESIDHAALYDAGGVRLAVVGEENLSLDDIDLPETLERSMRDEVEELHVGTGEVELALGEPRVLLVVRIRVDDETTGYVASRISLEDVQQRVERLAAAHFPGHADSLFIVDPNLRVVAHANRELAAEMRSARGEGIFEGVEAGAVSPTFSQAGEFDAADGTPMLGSSTALPSRSWVVVAQVPQSIAYASLKRMLVIEAVVFSVALFGALFIGLLVARFISKPVKRLTQQAHALAVRNFTERADVSTRDELAVLAHGMNHAAAALQASEAQLKYEAEVRNDLGRYIPEQLVDQIVRRERDMGLGGQRRVISVLFADVVAFTPLTEQLAPEHVVTILNELFTILTGIVFEHHGMVDKFVGDCVMALFSVPEDDPDHAARAIEAAEDMQSWLETGNRRWEEQYGVRIQLAIGIHSGEAIVGNVGSERRMEFTAIGEVVNVAARLEAMARPGQILITEATRQAAGPDFDYGALGQHEIAGRTKSVQLYEVRS